MIWNKFIIILISKNYLAPVCAIPRVKNGVIVSTKSKIVLEESVEVFCNPGYSLHRETSKNSNYVCSLQDAIDVKPEGRLLECRKQIYVAVFVSNSLQVLATLAVALGSNKLLPFFRKLR